MGEDERVEAGHEGAVEQELSAEAQRGRDVVLGILNK
jgi:hypothetical protein